MPVKLLRLALALSLAVAAPLRAQTTSPTDDLITRVIADVNDLRYADAIRRGYEVFTFARTLTPSQEVLLRSAIAAAFYPEEVAAQLPDSAIAQFVAAIQRVPDHTLPIELQWAGLDSLLEVARARTFVVQVNGDEQTLVGPTGQGTLTLLSSRPARFTLRTALLGSTAANRQDSTAAMSPRATLRYRAHDGTNVLLAEGAYTATIVAHAANGDSTVITRRLDVTGARLMLIAPPALDSTKLVPETGRPKIVKAGLTTLAFALVTFAIGGQSGTDDDFGTGFKPDGRSTFVGLTMLSAGVFTYFMEKNKTNPTAVAANTALRDAHRKAMDDAEAQNRTRIAQYRVTVKLAEETR